MPDVIQVAKERADLYGVRDVLVATAGRGDTARRALRVFGAGYRIYAVGNPTSSHERGLCLHPGISDEKRRELEGLGIKVALYECSMGQGEDWYAGGEVYGFSDDRLPGDVKLGTVIDNVAEGKADVVRGIVLRMFDWFGESGRVCLEIAFMAADSGAIAPHTRVIAISTPVDLGVSHACMVVDLAKSEDLFSRHFGVVDVAQVPQYTPLIVSDLRRAFRFYRDLVGLRVLSGDESADYAEFALGAGRLALAEVAALPVIAERTSLLVSPASRGNQELLFAVDDVRAVRDRLVAADVAIERGEQPWITKFRDPDGNQVRIMPR
jgi:catechol 2,3-dioxygenase-like lactoylglutathione lyase family enzyme